MFKWSPVWPGEAPAKWLVFFSHVPIILWALTRFLVQINTTFQAHFTLCGPQNQPFLQGVMVPGSWNCCLEATIWVLSMVIALGCHCFQALSVHSARKLVYSLEYLYRHTHLQPHLFLSVYVNCKPCVHTSICHSSPTPQGSFWLFPSHFSNSENPGFRYLDICTCLINPSV